MMIISLRRVGVVIAITGVALFIFATKAHAQFGRFQVLPHGVVPEVETTAQSLPAHASFAGATALYSTTLPSLTYTYTGNDAGRPGATKDIGLTQTLDAPGISIQYGVAVYEVDSDGAKVRPLTDGATVPAGTRVLYEFKPHVYTDVAWYGTGGVSDTPYGLWSEGAVFPPSAPFCIAANSYPGNRVLFAIFAVDPPAKRIDLTGVQATCSLTADGVSQLCTLSDPGEISAMFAFDSTSGHFFAGYNHGGNYQDEYKDQYGCESRGRNPMGLKTAQGPYDVPIPSRSIPFTISVTPSEDQTHAPSIPSLTSVGECSVGQPHSISMQSTDPDNDTIHYGIDWDADGSVDEFVPPSGYVPSGTARSASRTYSIAGSKVVKVLAQDSNGLSSSWASVTFSCTEASTPATNQCTDSTDNDGDGEVDSEDSDCATSGGVSEFTAVPPASTPPPTTPTADLRLSVPSLVGRGKTVQVVWSADNVSSCLPVTGTNGDSFAQLNLGNTFFSPIGGRTSSPITMRTTYTLACVDLQGINRFKTATVSVQPNFRER